MVLSNIYDRSRNLQPGGTRRNALCIAGHQNRAPQIPMRQADACYKLSDRRGSMLQTTRRPQQRGWLMKCGAVSQSRSPLVFCGKRWSTRVKEGDKASLQMEA
jgi:hypothetical protein